MAVFSAIGAAIGTAAFGGFMGASGTLLGMNAAAWGAGLGSLLGGVAMNALSTALAGDPQGPGVPAITQTMQEGVVARSFVLGNTAVAGSSFYKTTNGLDDTNDPERFYIAGVALSDVPIQKLHNVWVDDRFCAIDPAYTPRKGHRLWPSEPDEDFLAWVTFYDGTQTEADPILIDAATDDYKWTADDIGWGIAYAVVVCEQNVDAFLGYPTFLFVVEGVPLTGLEKGSPNLLRDRLSAVQAKALLNGIYYDGDLFYGPATAGFTPAQDWDAAIAKCGQRVPSADGWTNKQKEDAFGSTNVPAQFRSGLEIKVDTPIADALSDILTSCNGKLSYTGSEYKIAVGEPGPAVMSVTDDDILITRQRSFAPFLPLAETVNSVVATYPEPLEKYADQEAPPLIVPEYEAEDGDRRLTTTVQLRSVPYSEQAQRLMKSALAEARRTRRVSLTLPPKYYALEPLDVIALTTERDQFAAKLFRVDGLSDEPTGDVTVDLTEVDPADYDYSAGSFTPPGTEIIVPVPPAQVPLVGFGAQGFEILNDAGVPVRPAARLYWDPTQRGRGMAYIIYAAGTNDIVTQGSTLDFRSGEVITGDNITKLGEYEAIARRLKPNGGRTPWSQRFYFRAPNIGIGPNEIEQSILDSINEAQQDASEANDLVTNVVNLTVDGPFGVLLDQLQVNAGSTSAKVETLGGAIADLQGNAAAAYVIRVTAGSAGAFGEFVAADNPDGPASAIRFAADNILLQGTVTAPMMAITDFVNRIPGGDMEYAEALNFDLTPQVTLNTSVVHSGKQSLRLAPGTQTRRLAEFTVQQGEEYRLEFWVRISADFNGTPGLSKVRVGNQVNTLLHNVSFDAGTIPKNQWVKREYEFSIGLSTQSGVIVSLAADHTTGFAYIDGMTLFRKGSGKLIVDGTVEARHLDVITLRVAGLSIFGEDVRSLNYQPDVQGWLLSQNGPAEFPNGIKTNDLQLNSATEAVAIEGEGSVNVNVPAGAQVMVMMFAEYTLSAGSTNAAAFGVDVTIGNLGTLTRNDSQSAGSGSRKGTFAAATSVNVPTARPSLTITVDATAALATANIDTVILVSKR